MTCCRSVVLAAALAAALAPGCKRDDPDRKSSVVALPPLAAPSPTAALPVTGFGAAVVAPPAAATRPMPVLVAVLGVGDTPEEQCTTWREIVGARAFVLCPRGAVHMVQDSIDEDGGAAEEPSEDEPPVARADAGRMRQVGFYPVDVGALDREVTAALAALKARYGPHVSERDLLYTGFSRGAFLGASLAAKHPERFKRLVLIEGGQSPWQAETVAAFARGGGARVLFTCGQPKCVEESEAAAALLRAQKVDTRIVHGAGEGHGYKKQVKEELRRSFDWVVAGDPAWQAR